MSSVPLLVLLCCSLLEGQTVRVNGVTLRQHEDQENEIQSESPRDNSSTQQSCRPDIYSVLREMSAMLAELKVEQRHTTTAVNNIETSLRDTQSRVEELKKMVEVQSQQNQKELKDLKESFDIQIENLQKEYQERKVAFSASLSGGEAGNKGPYSTDVPLVYKHVFTNIGNAYNPATGLFTAPVRGVYQFTFFLLGGGGRTAGVLLYKNGNPEAAAHVVQSQGSVSCSNGVSLLLEVGDVVCIKLERNAWVYDDTWHYTTFSGDLLFSV